MVFDLVLACFLYLANPGNSHQQCSQRAVVLASCFCNSLDALPDYPDCTTYLHDLSCIACTCGEVVLVGSGSWGTRLHCPVCKGKSGKFFAGGERGILPQVFERRGIPRIWTEYAVSIAINLHKLKSTNRKSVTVLED